MSTLWILRVTYVVCIIFCYVILITEVKNNAIFISKNKFELWLRRLSITVYLLAAFRTVGLLLFTFPDICRWINPRYFIPNGCIHFVITLYQITRLYYCFKSQIDTKKSSKCIIYFYYLNGILLFLYTIAFRLLFFRVVDLHSDGCQVYRTEGWKLYLMTGCIWHYIWSFSVVFYYIHSVKQLQKMSVINNWRNSMEHSAVNLYLRKILILTVGVELSGLSSAIVGVLTQTPNLLYINVSIQHAFVSVMMYLMMEHNVNTYIKLMRVLTSKWCIFHCCCCSRCKSFIYSSLPSDLDNQTVDTEHHQDPQIIVLSQVIPSKSKTKTNTIAITSTGQLDIAATNNTVNVHSKTVEIDSCDRTNTNIDKSVESAREMTSKPMDIDATRYKSNSDESITKTSLKLSE